MLDRTEVGQSVDVLSEVLDTVHLQAAEAQVLPAELEFPQVESATACIVIFVVLSGRYTCNVGGERVEIAQGDAMALLRGAQLLDVTFAASPRDSGIDLVARRSDEPSIAVASVQPAVLRCICHFTDPEKNPLLSALPRLVHVASHQWVEAQWLVPTIRWLEREAAAKRPGANVVINRLVELLWVQLIRTHIATTPVATQGWLRALSDTQIGAALGLIHEKPAMAYTVAGLAQAVGMSRSAFASQFTRLVGEPPLHYVARWRMLKASQLLKSDKQTLAEVALAVGYESEAAFSKAFKRWSGQAPGSYRRVRRSEPPGVAELLAG